jgi:cytochrome c
VLSRLLLAAAFTSFLSYSASSQDRAPASAEVQRIEGLVSKAAELVDAKGKAAFSEFRQRDGEWWKGNVYLFAYAPDGTVLLNPATPSREGKSYHGEKDKKGKLFHDALVETAKTKGSGWVDYWLPKPGATEPSQKWSYVKAVKADGIALVGAGFYPD